MTQDRSTSAVRKFVAKVASRLNWQRWWTTLVWATVVGAGALALAGLWYVLRGYAIPTPVALACVGAAALLAVGVWAAGRYREDRAARFADDHFQLKDAVASALHFERQGRREGYYALQSQQAAEAVAPLDPGAIPYKPPRRGMMLAAGLLAVAVPLSLQGPSDEVLRQQQLAEVTHEQTAALNEELAELVEQLDEATTDPDEEELLKPDELRRWVEELETTTEHREALRQYAALERKFNKARLALQRKAEEQLLDRAAQQLRKGRETESLAKSLEQKKYQEAAKGLEKLDPKKQNSLEKWQRDLARLKAASQRMAAAARASQGSGGGDGGDGAGELAQTIEELADSVEQLDQSLDDAQQRASQLSESDADSQGRCQACQQKVSDNIAKLSKQLKKLGICRQCDKKLASLCQKCSQCQSGLCQSLAACQGGGAGGQPPGWGSNAARRDQRDELVDNGQTTQLKGTKGAGPSLTTVEAADDGSGVSTRRAAARTIAFERQLESFVAREDVPGAVKEGVKRYFENIHQLDPAASQLLPPNESDNP